MGVGCFVRAILGTNVNEGEMKGQMPFISSGSCDVSECCWVYFILTEGAVGDVDSIDPRTISCGRRSLSIYRWFTG